MPYQAKIFRVFVSSTFTDMKEERRILQEIVFPKLENFCKKNRARFQGIDLRWGINEESKQNQKTLEICFNEIVRCQRTSLKPNFIAFLGNRYGQPPIPEKIPEIEMEQIKKILGPSMEEELDIVNKKIKVKDFIKYWYKLDINAVPPEYVLQRWEKLEKKPDEIKDELNEREYNNWKIKEDVLRKILISAVNKATPEFTEKQKEKYFYSTTHQEIIKGILDPLESIETPKEHAFVYIRNIKDMPEDNSAKDYIDLTPEGLPDDASRKHLESLKEKLKQKLDNNHFITYEAQWQNSKSNIRRPIRFAAIVHGNLKRIIKTQIKQPISSDEINQEDSLHRIFKEKLITHFHGRGEILNKIDDYLNGSEQKIFSIIGKPGIGKSSVLAKAIFEFQAKNENAITVFRFIGTTSNSSNIVSLLKSICEQIADKYEQTLESLAGTSEEKIFNEINELTKILQKCLEHGTTQKPVVVFLDALDQLSEMDNAKELYWLPRVLPEHSKFVVSALPELEYKLNQTKIERLPELPEEDAEIILKKWFDAINRHLTTDQWKEVLNRFREIKLPIYLKLAFEKAKHWHSYDVDISLPVDVNGIINGFMDTLELEHTEDFVRHIICYMLCGRYGGLAENEILEILVFDKEYWKIFLDTNKYNRKELEDHKKQLEHLDNKKGTMKIPIVVWARLFFDLEPFITERDADGIQIITFFHTIFIEVLRKRYHLTTYSKYYYNLAEYFKKSNSQPLYLDMENKKSNTRKLVELPWQQTKAEMLIGVTETLSDLLFLEAKCINGLLYDLLSDFDRSYVLLKIHSLTFVRQAITSCQSGLFLEPNYFLSMLYNRLKWLLPNKSIPKVFYYNLDKAKQKLMNSSAWLNAIAPLPETKHLKPHEFPIYAKKIQSLNMKSECLAITDGIFTIDILDIRTGELKIRKHFDIENITGISTPDCENRIAAIDKNCFLYYENMNVEIKTRQNEHLLECVSDNLIFIRSDDCLVAWNSVKKEIKILLSDVPKPLVILRKSREGSAILFVAGYKNQIYGVAYFYTNGWFSKLLPQLSAPIVAGDIEYKSGMILLATTDSMITLFDFVNEKIFKQWSYQYETGSRLRGMAKKVSFGTGPSTGTIYLATESGQVWNWNFKTDQFSSFGDYKKHKEGDTLLCLDVWSDTGLPFVSTENNAKTLVRVDIASNISHPITSICFTNNNHIVTANYEGHSVCVYKAVGLEKTNNFNFNWPSCITECSESGFVWVGSKTGSICKISNYLNHAMIVANPVIGIFKSTQPDMIWVAQTNGDIICIHKIISNVLEDKQRTIILWNSTGYERRLKVLPASDNNTFWCMSKVDTSQSINISLVQSKQNAIILDERPDITDIAVSNDYKLFATAGNSIILYHFVNNKWEVLYTCNQPVKLISFTGDKNYLITAFNNWLFVHKISPTLPVITAHDLTSNINCLATKDRNLSAGLQSGDVVSFRLEASIN